MCARARVILLEFRMSARMRLESLMLVRKRASWCRHGRCNGSVPAHHHQRTSIAICGLGAAAPSARPSDCAATASMLFQLARHGQAACQRCACMWFCETNTTRRQSTRAS